MEFEAMEAKKRQIFSNSGRRHGSMILFVPLEWILLNWNWNWIIAHEHDGHVSRVDE